jgi:hypothetical protein
VHPVISAFGSLMQDNQEARLGYIVQSFLKKKEKKKKVDFPYFYHFLKGQRCSQNWLWKG